MMQRLLTLLILLGLAFPIRAAQEAGQVLFVAGSVSAQRESVVPLKKSDAVFEQDVIVTAARSRGQLLMRDGAKFSLRPNTEFVVEEYFLAGDEREQSDGSVVVSARDSAVTGLIKGGFRTITGAIGKDNPDDYVVETPGATMGIRGTHYSVVWCAGDCQPPPGISNSKPILDGLYIVITDGIVVIRNSTGEYTLNAGEFIYVRNRDTAPVRLPEMPSVLIDTYPTDETQEEEAAQEITETIAALGQTPAPDGTFVTPAPRATAPTPRQDDKSSGETGDKSSGDGGTGSGDDDGDGDGVGFDDRQNGNDGSTTGFNAEPVIPLLTSRGPITDGQLPDTRPVALSSDSITGLSPSVFSASSNTGDRTFAGNDLTAFQAPPGMDNALTTYAIGTAMILDDGFDPVTGIGWGRWSQGMAAVTTVTGTAIPVDLTNRSIAWVYGPELAASTSVPITGTAEFSLIAGNTDPADSLGNTGVLGNASLSADFTNSIVTSELLLAVGGRDWVASGTGTISENLFDGLFNTVVIGGQAGGSGNFSGFFGASAANGFPSGAGMTYGLSDTQGVSVTGAVVFGEPTL